METTYVAWAVLAAFFLVSLYGLMGKESKALRRDESARDPMFAPTRRETKKHPS